MSLAFQSKVMQRKWINGPYLSEKLTVQSWIFIKISICHDFFPLFVSISFGKNQFNLYWKWNETIFFPFVCQKWNILRSQSIALSHQNVANSMKIYSFDVTNRIKKRKNTVDFYEKAIKHDVKLQIGTEIKKNW